jgi:HEPN domain-containing protein
LQELLFMSTVMVSDIPLMPESPAQRLRRLAAAVRVHFTWWGVHRTLSARQKEEVGVTYDADARFLTAGKKLVDTRHEAFRRLTSLRTRVSNYWRGLTLPYVEAGVRLIRQNDIEPFVHTLTGFREELMQAEADLNSVYEEIKSDARRRLGRLYNPSDYPPEVRGLFGLDWDFPSVEPPSYLLRIAPEVYEQEQERIVRRFEEAVELAEQAFVTEFARLVSHLTERLSSGCEGERKVFRDTAVTNLMDFFEKFRHLNVRSNAQLDELVEQAQRVVQGVAAQELRNNEGLRQHVATQLAGVQSVLDGMLVDRPRRSLVRNRPNQGGQ